MKYCVLLWMMVIGVVAHGQTVDTAAIRADSIRRDIRLRFTLPQIYVPGGLIVAGTAATAAKSEIAKERNEHLPHFRTHVDNYLQYSPIFVAYGLDAFGIPSKTDIANRTAILIKGEILSYGTVFALKHAIHERRPDGSSYTSFPSGHTAQAFTAATLLSEEYKGRFKWMPYAAYSLASGVGILRMANNKHYICDVLIGAGVGMLSVKLAYWTHQYKWGKKKRTWVAP